jgi:hypothetical protein
MIRQWFAGWPLAVNDATAVVFVILTAAVSAASSSSVAEAPSSCHQQRT